MSSRPQLGLDNDLWGEMLDAEMNARYWAEVSRRYGRRDFQSRFLIAFASSGTVASWQFWSSFPTAWHLLSGFSAIVAIAALIVDLPKKISATSRIAGEWRQLQTEFELLWSADRALETASHRKRYEQLKKRRPTITEREASFPLDEALLKKCARQVKRARGLEEGNGA